MHPPCHFAWHRWLQGALYVHKYVCLHLLISHYGGIFRPFSASIWSAAWLNILAGTMSDGYNWIDRNLIVQIGDYIYTRLNR